VPKFSLCPCVERGDDEVGISVGLLEDIKPLQECGFRGASSIGAESRDKKTIFLISLGLTDECPEETSLFTGRIYTSFLDLN